jgi:hypothetical protein
MDVLGGGILADFNAYNPGFAGGVFVAAGDVNGDGRADFVTGADAGGGPHVRIFDAVTRTEIRGFFAYGAGFTGGVRVGTTDFNGDGIADIITGAGAGGGPHVRILRGDNLGQLANFFAYHPGFTGGVYVGGSIKAPGSPLRSPGNAVGDAEAVTAAQVQPLVEQALAGWGDSGLLRGVDVRLADLPTGFLAMAHAEAIYLDITADGHGWFVDATPASNEEFELVGGELRARESGPAAGRIDLLTAIAHELGHVLGLDDVSLDDDEADLMAEALPLGVRRTPSDAVDAVFDHW